MAGNKQLTFYSKTVLVVAAVAAVIGVWDIVQGGLAGDWDKLVHGAVLLLLALAASWLFSRFGAPKR